MFNARSNPPLDIQTDLLVGYYRYIQGQVRYVRRIVLVNRLRAISVSFYLCLT